MEPENVEVGDTVEDRFTGNLCTVKTKEKSVLESDSPKDVYVQLESVHDNDIGIGTRHINDLNPL